MEIPQGVVDYLGLKWLGKQAGGIYSSILSLCLPHIYVNTKMEGEKYAHTEKLDIRTEICKWSFYLLVSSS